MSEKESYSMAPILPDFMFFTKPLSQNHQILSRFKAIFSWYLAFSAFSKLTVRQVWGRILTIQTNFILKKGIVIVLYTSGKGSLNLNHWAFL